MQVANNWFDHYPETELKYLDHTASCSIHIAHILSLQDGIIIRHGMMALYVVLTGFILTTTITTTTINDTCISQRFKTTRLTIYMCIWLGNGSGSGIQI